MLLVNRHLLGQSHCGIGLVLLWINTIVSLVSAGVNVIALLPPTVNPSRRYPREHK